MAPRDTHNDFNSAAKASYKFDFRTEVEAFYEDHPGLKKSVFFLDVSAPAPNLVVVEGQSAKEIVAQISETEGLIASIKEAHKDGSVAQWITIGYNEEGSTELITENHRYLFLNAPKDQEKISMLGHGAPADVVSAFIFDHEAGHTLGDREQDTPNMRECFADAYAVIRHLQRFGKNTDLVENLLDVRSVVMMFSTDEGEHFTGPVLEKIIADAGHADFSSLTATQTIQTARDYATAGIMDPAALKDMASTFEAFQGKGKWPQLVRGDHTVIAELGDTVLSATSRDTVKWGTHAISAILDGVVGAGGMHVAPEKEEWAALREKLTARKAPQNKTLKPEVRKPQ